MIFRQIFHKESSSYSYLMADRLGGEALIIDPVLDMANQYTRLIKELELNLVLAADTHVHADRLTALNKLRNKTDCMTAMGDMTHVECVSLSFKDNETLSVGEIKLGVIYTPGHTDDSYSFRMADRVFTGDTLLIRGTGRTDFQGGDAAAQYDSLFGRLLTLPDDTLVYPAHDYNGMTVSTIGEEKRFNPRLRFSNKQDYVDMMNKLEFDDPKMMDLVVYANRRCGLKAA